MKCLAEATKKKHIYQTMTKTMIMLEEITKETKPKSSIRPSKCKALIPPLGCLRIERVLLRHFVLNRYIFVQIMEEISRKLDF